ncbi:helix-turn-helix domain-containing protein [Flavobacterium nackdongense]|uniref:AraC family transcriptional regulator n=1 Tax=Flavobacterium nackdongense TaxID=2547394 RepID=A0A4P6YDW0_9FLAO|nr:helix-turn-helix domain-containing protein [Flavobacterium nackdongense]QBN19074.1 AraC family transcriptional regulator [Flavobacterium nackdongense]
MLFQFGFYSSLLLISFSQGIIYGVLLLVKAVKTENKSNYWLSLFIFLCSSYIAPWMLGFAGWYDNQPYRDFLFYTPFQHLFLIGPIIFFYTQSLLNPSFKFTKKEAFHLIPGCAYLLYSLIIWVYDKFIFGDYYFYKDGADKDFANWYQNLGLLSMIIYFVLSIRYYNIYKKLIFQVVSFADAILFKWVKTYLIAFLVMLLLPIVFDIIGLVYPEIQSYQGSWWFFLLFSIVMYYIAITGYSNPINSTIPFKMSFFDKNPIVLLNENQTNPSESIIDIEHEVFEETNSPEITYWKSKIEIAIQGEKLFENPELTLTDVAKKLETNAAVISKTINQGFQMNFNDCINNYRTEAVKIKFANGEHKKSTLLGIAFDCGFNSKATFNRAFKKNTGKTPKEFLESL